MTIQDFKDKIHFDTLIVPENWFRRVHRASIHLTVTVESSSEVLSEETQNQIKETLTRRLMALLYESRNRELIKLLMEYEKAQPFGNERYLLFNKILKCAHYQPPTT